MSVVIGGTTARKPYLTLTEAAEFKKLLDSGRYSVFRTSKCTRCSKPVPKALAYCCKACWESANHSEAG